MAFHGFQPNFKQIDLSVETGTGTNASSGAFMFHNTSGLVQHLNGDWAGFQVSLALGDLSDVNYQSGPFENQILGWDGSEWIPINNVFDGLTDLDVTTNSPQSTSDLSVKSDGDGTYSFVAKDLAVNVAGDIGDLDNVTTAGIASGQWIESNGTTFIVRTAITLADLSAELEDLSDVDGEQSTANLQMISDGDGTYSFAAMDLSTNVGGDLGDLDNVTAVATTSGQVLMANGSTFIMNSLSIGDGVIGQMEDFSDVTAPLNADTKRAVRSDGDGTYSFYLFDLAFACDGDLGDLENVTAVASTSGQVLMADGSDFVMNTLALGDEVSGQLEDLSDVDSSTNSPQSTADLSLVSDGDGTYSFKDIASARRSISSISASTTGVVRTVYIVDTSGGAVTFTAPAAHAAGDEIVIKCAGSSQTNAITIATADADTIDGAASKTLESNWGSIRLESDGANWHRA